MMCMLKNLVAESTAVQAKEFVGWLSPEWIMGTLLSGFQSVPDGAASHRNFSGPLRREVLALLGNIVSCGELR